MALNEQEIEWSIQGVVPASDGEKVSRIDHAQEGDLAKAFVRLGGYQGHPQGELVVVRNEPSLDGIGHRLPPLPN